MSYRATTITVEIQKDSDGWRIYTDHREDGSSKGSIEAGLAIPDVFAAATRFLKAVRHDIAPDYPDDPESIPVASMPFMRQSEA